MTTSITPPVEDRLITPDQAAQMLGVKKSTLSYYRKIHRGPKFVQIRTNNFRYKLSDLQAYIAEQESQL